MINIADTTLKNRLCRDYDDDAHGAWTYIEHLREVKDIDTRITKASDERKGLMGEGMASGTEAAASTMVGKLLELNSELEGFCTSLEQQFAVHHPPGYSGRAPARRGSR
eukprot:1493795-Pleurochrysis_carterae.AAC.1